MHSTIDLGSVSSKSTLLKENNVTNRNPPTALWWQLVLQEALGAKGRAEYLRERRCQLTWGGRQLQGSENG